MRQSALILGLAALSLLATPVARAQTLADAEPIRTAIAYQQFQHGFMLWRLDNGQITVGYSDILAKNGAPCQEVYRDTYEGQAYELPPVPAGLTVPRLGFGWLHQQDPQLAGRLGYAVADEVSRDAEIRVATDAAGVRVVQLQLDTPIEGISNPLSVAFADQPGLTYCFPRGSEQAGAINTWIAFQRFQYGAMLWRQDRPSRVSVIHEDTEYAPEASCGDTFIDTWVPGETLDYGDLAVPGRLLPVAGFGKVWLQNLYVQESLGYPIRSETGGFAVVKHETHTHPDRADSLVLRLQASLADRSTIDLTAFVEGVGSIEDEALMVDHGCQDVLRPHRAGFSEMSTFASLHNLP
jgi:hypothetical protein